ncbi:MAG TPA: multiheme c-type cytochrome, partial [Planctomycetota bacterium]|nr:multiheme c-type cytochrome [Planctomycetota bacterium]
REHAPSPDESPPALPGDAPKLLPPEACQPCHPQHYEEWRGSMHAYAIEDPVFHAMNLFGQRDTRGELGDFCVRCHAPAALLTGEARPDLEGPDELSPAARAGISCEVCHRDVRLHDSHPGNLSLEIRLGGAMVGGIEDPVPNGFHSSKGTKILRSPEFCGACHNVINSRGVFVEKSYEEYVASEYPDRHVKCIDCHMQVYAGRATPDGPIRPRLHRHDFVGVDVALTPFPHTESQRREIEDFLRTAAVMTVRLPDRPRKGERFELEVDVKNAGAGHNLPTGPSTERQMWLEVTVETPRGETIFRSGHLGADGELHDGHGSGPADVDPQLAMFTDRFLDAEGREVPFMWQAHSLDERTIPPLATRTSRYVFDLPADLEASSLEVRARLLFRAFPPHQLVRLDLEEIRERFPIFVLQEFHEPRLELLAPAPPGVIRVPEDIADVAAAVRNARAGDEIIVGPGRHEVASPLDFAGRDLLLRSREGPETTILVPSAELGEEPLVIFARGETRGAALEGITLDGEGRANGRALICLSADPRIERVVLRGHRSSEDGGAALFEDSFAHVIESRFERNRSEKLGGALRVRGQGGVLIEDCVFTSNHAEAGGAISSDGGLILLRSRFERNVAIEGGALHLSPSVTTDPQAGAILVRHGEIVGNSAERGGGVLVRGDGSVDFERNVVAGNLGGGIDVGERASVNAPHTTLVDQLGGPASKVAPEARLVFSSSILFGNRPNRIEGEVAHSLVDDPALASGTNVTGFPAFAGTPAAWERATSPGEEGSIPVVRDGNREPESASWWRRYRPGSYRPLRGAEILIDSGAPTSASAADGTRPDLGAVELLQPRRLFRRGDVDGDGRWTTADIAIVIDVLARPSIERLSSIPCLDAADVDGDGALTPTDLAFLFDWLFGSRSSPLPSPFPECGPRPGWLGPGLGCFEPSCEIR